MSILPVATARRGSRAGTAFVALVLCAAFGCSELNRPSKTDSTNPRTNDPRNPGGGSTDPDVVFLGDLDLPLHVEEFAAVDRHDEPVRSGVPFPRSADIKSLDGLAVVSPDGDVVPAQFRVTARWGGAPDDATRPIKWLLVDFQASVPASGSRTYRLQQRSDASSQEGSLITENGSDRIVVSTGAATFRISKTRFNLFDRVTMADGTEIVGSDPNGGIYLDRPDGTRMLAAAGTAEVSVEEDGPLHAVIVARGKHKQGSSELLDWTVRLHFYQGRAESKVAYAFTDRSLASIRSHVAVDELGMSLPISTGRSSVWSIGGDQAPSTGALTGEAWLRQQGNLSGAMSASFNPGNADQIWYSTGGLSSGGGARAPGWIDVSGRKGGVTAAMRWFWQQYPKKLAAAPGRLSVEIWPSEEPDMRVYAAAQKTHEILWVFHDGSSGPRTGAAAAGRMDSPLFARCDPSWYASSEVWNRIGVHDQGRYSGSDGEVAGRYFTNLYEVEFPSTFGDRLYDSSGRGHAYSMWDFGDGRENGNFSNVAYDAPRSLFTHFAITGDRVFLDRGLESAMHLRDVDIEHSPLDTRAGIRNNRGVSKPWLGRTRYNPAGGPQTHDLGYEGNTGYGFEHHKGQGIGDHYFLTGDAMSKEVLAETYNYYSQWKVDADSGYFRGSGSRTVGHMLLVVLSYHDAFGTEESRQRADFIVEYLDDWQRTITSGDPNGWMWIAGSGDKTSTFMNAITAEALMQYEVAFPGRIPVRDNLVDLARWTIDPSNGQIENGSEGSYFNAWTDNNYGASHATILDAMIGPLLGYAYAATGEAEFKELGKQALIGCIERDSSSSYMKAFSQQTRLVPAFLYYLQKEDARQEVRQRPGI